ncbi:hypothetical protein AHAS_Ahas20G0086600 [Arachis hypogaea]
MLYGSTVVLSLSCTCSLVAKLFTLAKLLRHTFFAQAGFPCPALRNLSDHFLRCINSDFDKVKSTLKGFMKLKFEGSDDPLDKITTAEAIRTLIDYYRTSQHSYAVIQKVNEISKVKGTELNAGGSQASFFMQSYTLTKLSFINMSRDFVYYWLRLVIYIVVIICIRTIYLNVGTCYNSILVLGFFRFEANSKLVAVNK